MTINTKDKRERRLKTLLKTQDILFDNSRKKVEANEISLNEYVDELENYLTVLKDHVAVSTQPDVIEVDKDNYVKKFVERGYNEEVITKTLQGISDSVDNWFKDIAPLDSRMRSRAVELLNKTMESNK